MKKISIVILIQLINLTFANSASLGPSVEGFSDTTDLSQYNNWKPKEPKIEDDSALSRWTIDDAIKENKHVDERRVNKNEKPILIEDFSGQIYAQLWSKNSAICQEEPFRAESKPDKMNYCLEIKDKFPNKNSDLGSVEYLILSKKQIQLVRQKQKDKAVKLTIEQIYPSKKDYNFDGLKDYAFNVSSDGLRGCDMTRYFVKNPKTEKYDLLTLSGCYITFNEKEKRIYDNNSNQAFGRYGDFNIYEIENLQPKLIYREEFDKDPNEYHSCIENENKEAVKKCTKPYLKVSNWDGVKMVKTTKNLADIPTQEIENKKYHYKELVTYYLKDKTEFTSAQRVLFSFDLVGKSNTIYLIVDNLNLIYLNAFKSKSSPEAVDFIFPENSKNKISSENSFSLSSDIKNLLFNNKSFKYNIYYDKKNKKVGIKVNTPQGSSELVGNFDSIKGDFNFLSIKGIENVVLTK